MNCKTAQRKKKRITALAVMLLASQAAFAQKWETAGVLELTADQSDNPRLETGDVEEAFASHEILRVEAYRTTRTLDIGVSGEAEFVQFSQSGPEEQQLQDEENQRASLTLAYKPNSKMKYDLYSRYAHENYSSRQAVDFNTGGGIGADPAGDGQINDIQQQFRIDRFVVQPSVAYKATRRSEYKAFMQHYDTDFSDDTRLADYTTTQYSGEWIYSLSEVRLDALEVQLGYTDYESNGILNNANVAVNAYDGTGIPLKLTYIRSFKRGLYLAASAGVIQLDFDALNIDKQNEPLFNLYYGNDNTEGRHKYAFAYNDSVQPNSSGILIKSQSMRLEYQYLLSRKARVGLRSLIFRNEDLSGENVGREQDYFNLEPFFSMDIGRSMELSLRYRFRDFQRADGSDSEDNSFTATLKLNLWG